MKNFTEDELSGYNGKGVPAYVAYSGNIYDVSGSFLWKGGNHQAMHIAGKDLTGSMAQAPHGAEVLKRYPVVGNLRTTIRKPNRLISEKSPYLLQHVYNPVDWYPWGEPAFETAKRDGKPIFLSIGYSTCHWCHVMEKECFEDDEVAALMNDAFVCIKVDREERPDIDSVYMAVCQKMTGSGGWPLNIIITPDKKPFFAATYIPKESRFGQRGMLEIIPKIKALWKSQREELEKLAAQTVSAFAEVSPPGELKENILHDAYEQLLGMFDEEHGGFGDAPKFPTPHNLMFLLRYWRRTGDKMALWMVEKTLSGMCMGGIYDHVGFGFSRYSTDSRWVVPHFEKMLYDQALLAMAYTETYQATKKEGYRKIAREIFTYVLRDLTDLKEGGFYSGEDADSEGEEGKFYLWTEEEINSLLSHEEALLIKKVFNIDKNGNFAEGKDKKRNILYLTRAPAHTASELGLAIEDFEKRLESARQKLFTARERRVRPGKDDKVLADWNGLMIAAFSKGAQVFDHQAYARAAKCAADFILSRMCAEGRLYHRYRGGESAISAFLDDYALLIWGLIELYETTFEVSYLRAAIEFNDILLEHFWDEENGGFYFTADDAENILVRKKEIYDGAVPSGNSVQMLNLLRLGRITGKPEFEKRAALIGKAFSGSISISPSAHTQLMAAIDFATGQSFEVVIAGDPLGGDTKAMLGFLRKEFIPNKMVLLRPDTESPEICRIAEYSGKLTGKENRATAYVCQNYRCKLPTTDPGEMMKLLTP